MTTPLQAARHARGWSQVRAVSGLMDIARKKEMRVASAASLKTQLSRWENGQVTPDDDYVRLICTLHDSTMRELGFGIDNLGVGSVEGRMLGTANIAQRERTRDIMRI